MTLTEQVSIASETIPPPRDPLQELFSSWGLGTGKVISGWTVDSVELAEEGDVAGVTFSRRTASIGVRFRRAGSLDRFARIGEIDIAHDEIDPALSADAGTLLKLIAAWLKRHEDGAALVPLLATSPLPRKNPEQDVAEQMPIPNGEHPAGAPASAVNRESVPGQPYIVVHEAPPLDPAKQAPPDRPVLDFEFIDVADLDRYSDALREIYRGERGGLVIRGVYSKEEVARVVSRLESSQKNFPLMYLPESQKSYFLGLCLEGGDPTLKDYLNAAERFRSETLPVFEGMEAFETRIERLFRSLGGGRKVQLAQYPDGRFYTPATIRILPVGGQLAPHCGNEMYSRPSYEHLKTFVDNHDQISYFLTLQDAEEGGGLIIYSLKWSEVGPENILPDERSNVGSLLGESEWMEVRPSAGDVLVFDGGRYLHRVDWVQGSRTRWTMGGFLMFDRAGETVLYFA